MNPFLLVVALVDVTGVVVHGYVGHRAFLTPLTTDRLFPTRLFGDAASSRRVFVVTWHAVTAAFATSAVMMSLMAFGAFTSRPAALFASAMHAGFALVALAASGWRIIWPPKRRPLGFVVGMSTAALLAWLGSR